jgi:ornithine cyclodeaminase/alanine dehydrogenase-like protein (mu-crystallin family)
MAQPQAELSRTVAGVPIAGFRILAEADTQALVTMRDAMHACQLVFEDLGLGRSVISSPPAMFLEAGSEVRTHLKVKGGYVAAFDVCGFRIAGDRGETGEEHYCYLLDPNSTKPIGLIAQTHLNRLRTAATGLLAAKLLANKPSPVVALIGSGRIGSCLAEGFLEVFPDSQLRIASRRAESAKALAMRVASPAVQAFQRVSDAVSEADVIIALSSARQPVLASDVLRPGVTVVGMGEHHELSHELLNSADRFFVDDLEFATVLGSLAAWIANGLVTRDQAAGRLTGSLGEVAAGKVQGRTGNQERILAIVQGVALADIALAEICRRRSSGEQWPPKPAP